VRFALCCDAGINSSFGGEGGLQNVKKRSGSSTKIKKANGDQELSVAQEKFIAALGGDQTDPLRV